MKQILYLKEYNTYHQVNLGFNSNFNKNFDSSVVFIDCCLYEPFFI